MSGLPATRPDRATYGPTMSNDMPIKRPNYEPDAENWNKIATDLAFCGQVVPKAILCFTSDGADAVLTSALGIPVDNWSLVTLTAGSLTVTIDLDVLLGVLATAATGTSNTTGSAIESAKRVTPLQLLVTFTGAEAVDGATVVIY